MRSARLVVVVVAMLGWRAGQAHAHDAEGCPPYPGAHAGAFGYTPDVDSALGPSRAGITEHSNQMYIPGEKPLMPAIGPDGTPGAGDPAPLDSVGAWIGTLTGYAQVNRIGFSGVVFGVRFSRSQLTNYSQYQQNGNVIASIGYRKANLKFGNAMRAGFAFQLGQGISPDGNDSERDSLNRLAVRTPFNTELFAFDRPIVATLEARFEIVGCHAPFLHLRIGAVGWRADPEQTALAPHDERDHVLALPVSLTLGYDAPWAMTVGGQAALEFRRPESVLLVERVTRIRLFLDKSIKETLHVSLYGGLLAGKGTSGAEGGGTVEVQWQ